MSDKELIIRSLKKVERRIRTNRLLRELALGLSLLLLIPLLFKIWDLFRPFRGATVTVVIGLWLTGVAVYVMSRLRAASSLSQTAAVIDRQASLRDEIKSAYWFVSTKEPPAHSRPWIDYQVRRAAERAGALNVDQLFPRTIPKTAYVVMALVVLVVALNFAPTSINHNWLYMQAAPAFTLSAEERRIIEQTKQLLKQAQQSGQPELAKRLEDVIKGLEGGTIDPGQALKQLDNLRQTLSEGDLDLANINDGLDEMAADLGQSPELNDAAQAMSKRDLQESADDLKKAADALKSNDAQAMKAAEDALKEAAENSHPGMENLAQDMKKAADSLANQDAKGMQDAMNQAASDLQDLEKKIESQEAKSAASEQIQNLQNSLRQRQQMDQGPQKAADTGQQAPGQKGQKGEAGKPGENQKADQGGDSSQGGEAGGENAQMGARSGEQPADPNQAPSDGSQGKGQNPSGTPQGPLNINGAPTKLEVQLEKEQLSSQNDGGLPENIEEASKQERSKLDYRNVPSELTPAQKDVLNQDKIPWEKRALIKNYFEAIRPPRGK